jgi:hypothetical protein
VQKKDKIDFPLKEFVILLYKSYILLYNRIMENRMEYLPRTPETSPPSPAYNPDNFVPRTPEISPPPPTTPKTPVEVAKATVEIIRPGEKKNLQRPPEAPKTLKEKKEEFTRILKYYLDANPLYKSEGRSSELEIRFGTNTKIASPLSKIDYDNVVKQLMACGFRSENPAGLQILRIIDAEFLDKKRGIMKDSNIRTEIVGTDMIQEYCRTNSIQHLLQMPSNVRDKIKFTQKESFRTNDPAKGSGDFFVNKLDMEDFNFRVSLQTERDFFSNSATVSKIIGRWNDTKKKFRFMNRVRFAHPVYPIFADLSILKTSKKSNRAMMAYYTIQEADVFNCVESYEIELEIDNTRVGMFTPFTTPETLMDAIRKCIRIVLCGIQNTKYPISYLDQEMVLNDYMQMIHGKEYQKRRIKSKDFIGPSSFTLQIENIMPQPDDTTNTTSNQINIRKNYTVTDKADGDRSLLYIHSDGKIYLINTNMRVIFTGAKTNEKQIFNSLLDGEHIKYDKNGKPIHLYAAFDVYYINKKPLRQFPFYPPYMDAEERERAAEKEKHQKASEAAPKIRYRIPILNEFIEDYLKLSTVISSKDHKTTDFRVKCKEFYAITPITSIFDGCSRILKNESEGLYEYNTDGVIFTPADLAVGATKPGGAPSAPKKMTWEHSFKWKPVEFNTIDFLVSVKRDKNGKHEVHNEFKDGRTMSGLQEIEQYKTLILMCGFNEKSGIMNPFQNVIDDVIPDFFKNADENDDRDAYKPVPFQPTEPYDMTACFCKMKLQEVGTKQLMLTKEGEVFDEDMIVEFKYDINAPEGMKWIPLRVRYDKTAELNAGGHNYGNAFHVANSNWRSIHYPITETMITTGTNIPENSTGIQDVYYSGNRGENNTEALRDFHNTYVKAKLIVGVAQSGAADNLIDYAVGKAGDLSKWRRAKLRFVFGIDISKDNIHNRKDGACARFLRQRYTYNDDMPDSLFVTGDSKLNIREGKAFFSEKEKGISNAVFGRGPKDMNLLGKAVYRQYDTAGSGFQISSCQFALHYFFENKITLNGFMRNLAECTRLNGYFIGTCYDGKTVFNLLKNKEYDDGVTIMKKGNKMFEMVKKYEQTGFPDDELSLGYGINVFQESIHQVFREYLVNFDYLKRIMENYGFRIITKEEAVQLNLPDGTGMFSELFSTMETELKMNPKLNADYRKSKFMSSEEKSISFMNRYFVFKKVTSVDAKKVESILLRQESLLEQQQQYNDAEAEAEETGLERMVEENKQQEQEAMVAQNIVLKPKRKIVLKKYVPVSENPAEAAAAAAAPPTQKPKQVRKKKEKGV